MAMDPAQVPDNVTLRDFAPAQAVGEGKYQMDLYTRRRGDANIKTHADLINKANFYNDPTFPDRKAIRENAEKAMELNTADRMLRRFSVQQLMLQCMQEMNLDAITYPTSNLPPAKLGAPTEPTVNGRPGSGVWTFLGQQGFPAITVPAGFTTNVYDAVRDPSLPPPPAPPEGSGGYGGNGPRVGVRMVGPTPAKLPVGIDFMALSARNEN
jgi:Asp-tRNA(Asn)/Glu-tRNA(Gln) amidotransferase A subunit family amidase